MKETVEKGRENSEVVRDGEKDKRIEGKEDRRCRGSKKRGGGREEEN
jgi:hypothetical protein